MALFLTTLHVVVCIALILIVLFQTGKGADMGAAFGGGSSNTLFGSTGGATFLGKMTTVAAVIFMITSLSLGYISSHQGGDSVIMKSKAPVTQEAPAAPAAPAAAEKAPATAPAATDKK
ncbi:MAG: preprotein translocase subunit SecG [Desulfobacterales bacterium]|nr:preprotein translocase subunit SecG [Desulfobacterales bacterium]